MPLEPTVGKESLFSEGTRKGFIAKGTLAEVLEGQVGIHQGEAGSS